MKAEDYKLVNSVKIIYKMIRKKMQLLLTRHCLESVQGARLFPVLFRIHNPRLPRSRKAVGSITVGYRRFAWGTNVLSKSLPLHAHRLIHHPQPTLLQPVRTIIIRQLNAKWKSIHGVRCCTSTSSSAISFMCSTNMLEIWQPKHRFR
jgi:hypothetical protein